MDEENKEVVQEDVSAEPSADVEETPVEADEVPEVVESQPEETPLEEEVLE